MYRLKHINLIRGGVIIKPRMKRLYKKENINFTISAMLMILYIVTFAIDFFTFKSITIMDFGMCTLTLLGLFLIFRKLSHIYYLPAVAFAFFALYFGSMLDFYTLISFYDLLLHSASGVLLVFAGHLFYTALLSKEVKYNIPLKFIVVFCVLFSMAGAGAWEIWEFSGDVLFGLSSQGSQISDTMTDIIAGSVSAIIGGFILSPVMKNNSTLNPKKS